MDNLDKQLDIIESLYPDFTEYADNKLFMHWMEYACELDTIRLYQYNDNLVGHINSQLLKLRAGSPEHDACVDVASTLEEALPQFKGVFKYD